MERAKAEMQHAARQAAAIVAGLAHFSVGAATAALREPHQRYLGRSVGSSIVRASGVVDVKKFARSRGVQRAVLSRFNCGKRCI
jgi:hypothetical protein